MGETHKPGWIWMAPGIWVLSVHAVAWFEPRPPSTDVPQEEKDG